MVFIFISAILLTLFSLLGYSLNKYIKRPKLNRAIKTADQTNHLNLKSPNYYQILYESIFSVLLATFFLYFFKTDNLIHTIIFLVFTFPIIYFIIMSTNNSRYIHIDFSEIVARSFWSKKYFTLSWNDVDKIEFDVRNNSFYFFIKNSWDTYLIEMKDYKKLDVEEILSTINSYSQKNNLNFKIIKN